MSLPVSQESGFAHGRPSVDEPRRSMIWVIPRGASWGAARCEQVCRVDPPSLPLQVDRAPDLLGDLLLLAEHVAHLLARRELRVLGPSRHRGVGAAGTSQTRRAPCPGRCRRRLIRRRALRRQRDICTVERHEDASSQVCTAAVCMERVSHSSRRARIWRHHGRPSRVP